MHASDSIYKRMSGQPLYKDNTADPELDHKVKRVSDKISETMNVVANEPSLAFFRIQEHVRKTLPQLVDTKHEVEDVLINVQGSCFDADYAINAVKAMQSSAIHFQNIQDLLKNAMFMKQQIIYEDNRRKQGRSSPITGDRKPPPTSTDSTTSKPPEASTNSKKEDTAHAKPQTQDYNSHEKGNLTSDEIDVNKEVEELMAHMQAAKPKR